VRGDDAVIADFLLGELPEADRAQVERRIASDPAFAESVARMRTVVEGLDAMPPLGWPGDETPALPPLPPLPGLARRRRFAWPSPRPWVAITGAAAVLAAGVAIGALVSRDGGADAPPQGPALALARLGDAGPSARGVARVLDGPDGTLRVQVTGLAPSAGGDFYELWLMDDADRLVSLGAFRVPASGSAEVDVPLPVPVGDFHFIDVSREPEDGNPAHSGDSVLRGPTGTA
jgi:anti-sigma-K factor RskA